MGKERKAMELTFTSSVELCFFNPHSSFFTFKDYLNNTLLKFCKACFLSFSLMRKEML